MAVRVYVVFDDQEAQALTTLAKRELRYPKDQIRLFVREGLQRCGLLRPPNNGSRGEGQHESDRAD